MTSSTSKVSIFFCIEKCRVCYKNCIVQRKTFFITTLNCLPFVTFHTCHQFHYLYSVQVLRWKEPFWKLNLRQTKRTWSISYYCCTALALWLHGTCSSRRKTTLSTIRCVYLTTCNIYGIFLIQLHYGIFSSVRSTQNKSYRTMNIS